MSEMLDRLEITPEKNCSWAYTIPDVSYYSKNKQKCRPDAFWTLPMFLTCPLALDVQRKALDSQAQSHQQTSLRKVIRWEICRNDLCKQTN